MLSIFNSQFFNTKDVSSDTKPGKTPEYTFDYRFDPEGANPSVGPMVRLHDKTMNPKAMSTPDFTKNCYFKASHKTTNAGNVITHCNLYNEHERRGNGDILLIAVPFEGSITDIKVGYKSPKSSVTPLYGICRGNAVKLNNRITMDGQTFDKVACIVVYVGSTEDYEITVTYTTAKGKNVNDKAETTTRIWDVTAVKTTSDLPVTFTNTMLSSVVTPGSKSTKSKSFKTLFTSIEVAE